MDRSHTVFAQDLVARTYDFHYSYFYWARLVVMQNVAIYFSTLVLLHDITCSLSAYLYLPQSAFLTTCTLFSFNKKLEGDNIRK